MKKNLFACLLVISTSLNAQSPITSTKMELFGDHIFIKLNVDGSGPLDFIFDTSDGLPVIDMDLMDQLNLKVDKTSTKISAQGSIQGALIDHNYIELNGVELENDIELYATELDHLEVSIGKNIDGIVGYDLLNHYVVELDYDNMMFKLYDPESYKYNGDGERHHFKMGFYIPHITCTVTLNNGEVYKGEYFVSTGAGTTVDFNTPFAKKKGMVGKTGEHYSYLVKGLGAKEHLHYEGRIKKFEIGDDITLDNLAIGISQADKGVQAIKKMDGIIGNGLLKRFNLVFDYKNKDIYFEKHNDYNEKFHVNACGFEIQYAADMETVMIHRVYKLGAALKAGIETDSKLLEVNGERVEGFTLPELKGILNKHNSSVEIQVEKNGKRKTVVLALSDLL